MEKTARTPRLGGSLCAVCLVISLLCASEADVQAGEILQQVKASGVVRCSGVARPGLAERDGSGHWKGRGGRLPGCGRSGAGLPGAGEIHGLGARAE